MLVGEVRELHGLKKSVANHCGAEAGAEAEEEHATAFVAAESLHAGVVDNFYGMAEGFAEVEAHPAATEIVGFAERMTVDDRAGIAHGDAIVLPRARGFFHGANHFGVGHGRAGRNFHGFLLSAHQELDVCAADINCEDAAWLGVGEGRLQWSDLTGEALKVYPGDVDSQRRGGVDGLRRSKEGRIWLAFSRILYTIPVL